MEHQQEVSEIIVNLLRHEYKKARTEELLEMARRIQNSFLEVPKPENPAIWEYKHFSGLAAR